MMSANTLAWHQLSIESTSSLMVSMAAIAGIVFIAVAVQLIER
jgi:hypothetical protein